MNDNVAERWLTEQATRFAQPEVELIKRVLLKKFGTAKRALHMVSLFPGRFYIQTAPSGILSWLTPAPAEKYTLIDKLAPKEDKP